MTFIDYTVMEPVKVYIYIIRPLHMNDRGERLPSFRPLHINSVVSTEHARSMDATRLVSKRSRVRRQWFNSFWKEHCVADNKVRYSSEAVSLETE